MKSLSFIGCICTIILAVLLGLYVDEIPYLRDTCIIGLLIIAGMFFKEIFYKE